MKYSIRIRYKDGFAYLWHHDKHTWCKRTASKYLSEWNARNPENLAELEEAE